MDAPVKPRSWYMTPDGQPRGYIQARGLEEVWFHTGTACNLACPFCLEGSKPGDTRLQLVRFDDVRPLIDEAVALGVRQFSFTGGEPFIAREFHRILEYAARFNPCLVLTNGTLPLQRRLAQVKLLLDAPREIAFRISIDYPDRERHDEGRGAGMFDSALEGMRLLHELGFPVSVARQWSPDEDTDSVTAAFQEIFRGLGLPEETPIIWFPDFHAPGEHVHTPAITEHCMTAYHTEQTRADFMCAYSRMVVKDHGRMRVYACTLVDDDGDYDMGASLSESLDERVMLGHHRCFSCFRYGASCSQAHQAA